MNDMQALTRALLLNAEVTALAASLKDIPACNKQCGRLATKELVRKDGAIGGYPPVCDACAAEFSGATWRDTRAAPRIRRLERLLQVEPE